MNIFQKYGKVFLLALLIIFLTTVVFYSYPILFPRPTGSVLVDRLREQKNDLETTDLLDYLKNFEIVEDCVLFENCFEFYNDHEEWFSYTNPQPMILPTGHQYFVISINQKTFDKLGGIRLSNRVPDPSVENNWFGQRSLFVATGENGHRLYASIQEGESESHIPILDETIPYPQTTLHVIFDRQVKKVVVTNKEFDYFREIDISKVSGGTLPNGLFPDGKMHIGYDVEQYSYFIIDKFTIAPLDTK